MIKVRKGFTLTELVMAIILMALIGTIIGVIFNTMFIGQNIIDREANIQAEMRTTMQMVDNTVQRSTAIFVLDDSKYDGTTNSLTKEWSYIGLSEDGKKLINFVWNKATKTWDVKEMGTVSLYDMKLDIEFKTEANYEDNRVVKYELTGEYQDTQNKLAIDTAIMALNTKQVFSKVANGKKGVAIAYRTDPIEGQPEVAISFVFDTSGSMATTMNGATRRGNQKSRMNILKEKATDMMDSLADVGNVNVNLVTFSTLGEYVERNFLDLDDAAQVANIKTKINSLPTEGYTNPGDGLRYGLVSLKNNNSQFKYVVLLTDGLPNFATVVSESRTVRSRGTSRGQIVGGVDGSYYVVYQPRPAYDLTTKVLTDSSKKYAYESDLDPSYAIEYAKQVSQTHSQGVTRVSVIGFSAVSDDTREGKNLTANIKNANTDAKYYDATSEEQLKTVFADIQKQIEQDLWFAVGP